MGLTLFYRTSPEGACSKKLPDVQATKDNEGRIRLLSGLQKRGATGIRTPDLLHAMQAL